MSLQGKHILVGISGGIAAYKIPELIRLLTKQGAEVRVTATKSALQFVTELTLQTLSNARIYTDVFGAINEHSTEHISLPDWADLMVIAPATANVLGKMAHGIADDALTTTFCAMCKPVVIAPAMNDKMYANPATQQAMRTLSTWDNITMLDCAEGYLACGTSGKGRMQEVDYILEAILTALTPQTMTGREVLLTAGPTVECIDPVRYISNFSTGKMGYALARECLRRGAHVTLISGPTQMHITGHDASLTLIPVQSACEMHEAATTHFPHCDTAILCAAVADYAPANKAEHKLKKQADHAHMLLTLTENPDIAAVLGAAKQEGQRLIGFALETDHAEAHALDKLARKYLDMIVLNSLQDAGAGFGTDTNKVTLIYASGQKEDCPLMSKEAVAQTIIDALQGPLRF